MNLLLLFYIIYTSSFSLKYCCYKKAENMECKRCSIKPDFNISDWIRWEISCLFSFLTCRGKSIGLIYSFLRRANRPTNWIAVYPLF